jgi:UDP-N-acetylglucosamine 2-epimerase (non-hydrolysing)
MLKIINVVGARPDFIKIAPILPQFHRYDEVLPVLVHTGQHYDGNRSTLFFDTSICK